MRKIILGIIAIVATIPLFAQNNITKVLSIIEKNNTTLKALRETANAQQLENRTDIYLPDPEIGFNYLWGNSSAIGNSREISLTQSFDIPTISGVKSKVANKKNELIEWQYKANRMDILLEAKLYCIDLIYHNALLKELSIRLDHAEKIANGQKERLESGDGNILEYNNVHLNLSTIKGETLRIETERMIVISQLIRLNGGELLTFNNPEFAAIQMPIDFSTWYATAQEKNPVLSYVKKEIELSKHQVTLSKSMGLPTFSAGYINERAVDQRFQGISVGISVPLWSNKNRIKQAKSAVHAAKSRKKDTEQQFFSQLEIQYNRTLGLKNVADTYRASLANANNSALLKKALDAGQISILEYIIEMGFYYQTINQALEAERDYQNAFAELSAVEL